ncbi:snare associated Golgi protein-domain-containing protein [Umbelopsis sp. PMI_123]|nr:snare associated Golgi protein-domain-containing protein [Umbelopsis sp. PMI_123]
MKDHTVEIHSADNAEETSVRQPLIDPNAKSYSAVETAENGATITSAVKATNDDDQEAVKVVERRTWSWRSQSYKRSLASLIVLLIVFTGLQYLILKLNLPAVDEEDKDAWKVPRNLDDLRRLNAALAIYIKEHYWNVYLAFFSTYVYLQSFSIPGSMWLSILGGTLFDFWFTLFTVCLCSAIGATIAYFISASLASVFVIRNFGERIAKWNEELVHHRKNMFNYMIVLRIAPLPPNWMVNLGSPHLDVPAGAFFWGTFFGVAAPSFIHVQAGAALDRLSSSDKLQIFTPLNVICLIAVAVAALIPVAVRRHWNM